MCRCQFPQRWVNCGLNGKRRSDSQTPTTKVEVVGFVARGLQKLVHLRNDPRATLVARASWEWAAVEGTAEIVGPDDPAPHLDSGCCTRY